METSNQLTKRFKEVYLNGKWIANTNYKEILSDISVIKANKKVKSLNSIALLTNHVNYYLEGLIEVFKGNQLTISDKKSFDFVMISTEEEWEHLKNRLEMNANEFANYVSTMPNEKLNSTFVKEQYGTYRRNIEGIIEHGYYHLGQISLIKKLTA